MLKWPGREQVLQAARRWAADLCARHQRVREIFCVGSYARGDWGVGSDLDVIVVIGDTEMSLIDRRRTYEPSAIPVDVDVSVYTQREWDLCRSRSPLLWRRLQRERLDLVPPRVATGS